MVCIRLHRHGDGQLPDGFNCRLGVSQPDHAQPQYINGCAMNSPSKSHDRAQGLVEFAIILPILLLVLMLIFDVGRSIYAYSVIYNAAREGARYGIIHPTDPCTDPPPPNIETVVTVARHLTSGLDSSSIIVTCPDLVSGAFEVEVRYTFSAATPFLGRLLGNTTNSIDLVGHSVMNVEN